MIVKFENGKDILAAQVCENNDTGEVIVQDTYHCTVKNKNEDTVFGTNEQEITLSALEKEQTWDTREISMIIENDKMYYDKLVETVGNELYFIVVLWVIIDHWNEQLGDASKHIDPSKVNGNEVYVSFTQAVGNEQEGWK